MNKVYLDPRYWILAPILGTCWLLALLPYRTQMQLGRWLGRGMRHFMPKTCQVVTTNLQLCFPELTDQQRTQLLKKNFEAAGTVLFETALAWWAPDRRMLPLIHMQGEEHLQQALQAGKGVIFCSAHFLSLEIAGRLASTRFPFAVMYRPHKNPFLNQILSHYRNKIYKETIARNNLRGILRFLKENGIVWYTPDIDAGHNSSIFVPFFNVPAATVTVTARLAEMSGAKIVPAFFYRRDNNTGYDIVFLPALENFPSDNLEQDTARINQVIEEAIRKKPEQYLWQYKRFKTRPEGEERFYR